MIIEEVTREDFEEGRLLLREELGAFFDIKRDGICLLAKEAGQVVGAAFAPCDDKRAEKFIQNTFLQIPPKETLATAGLVVQEGWRGRGIGRQLLKKREKAAVERGYRHIVSESWLESPSPSAPLLRAIGMKEAARFPGYWRSTTPIPGYCSRCGDICSCTAILFYCRANH